MNKKLLQRKRCMCGRMILIATENKRKRIVCATCKTYGLELSRKMFRETEKMFRKTEREVP